MQTIWSELSGGFEAMSPLVAFVRLLAAIVLGGAIGFEREYKGKPAGLRTHVLVATAACLFVIVGQELATLEFDSDDVKRIDPLRLIEAVTSGVAFLAAGVIFTAQGKVQNVTTGASMWLAGAVGLACGAGEVPLAALATFLVVLILRSLKVVDRRVGPREPD